MKIGPFDITRRRKTAAGLDIYPWQALTEDRVSSELRQIIAKVARSEAKSYLDGMYERAETDNRLLEFIHLEMDRMARGHFVVDQTTLDKLVSLVDHLRTLENA